MHDLVVRGGTVVDGTGAPPRRADVAVDDGLVTDLGRLGSSVARRTLDADGLLVTPGWVDVHTHDDGQATWDDVLAPSAWSPEEIDGMKAIVKEALSAGALGFSTSRTIAHRAIDGEPVPGTFAAEDELFGIGAALGELGTGIFELAPAGSAGEDVDDPKQEIRWMRRLSAAIGRPVTFAMLQVDPYPELWAELLAESLAATAEGADIWPQVAGRPTGMLSGHHTSYSLFDHVPAYVELKRRGLAPDALYAALCDPEMRRRIVEWEPADDATAAAMDKAYRNTYLLGSPPDYEPDAARSLAAMAAAVGRTPIEVAYDAMLEGGGCGLLYIPILNYSSGDLEPTRQMLLHPRSALGLGDGGAHVGIICDASVPTFMLTHWCRDRTRGDRLAVEWVVRKQTRDTARMYGLTDRGTLEPGMLADLNLVDYERLELGDPWVSADLPAGGRRILQGATGYVATVKGGTATFEDGEDTGARPGRLVRGAQGVR